MPSRADVPLTDRAPGTSSAKRSYNAADLLCLVWRHKVVLTILPFAFGLAAFVASLLIPNEFRSTVVVVTADRMPSTLLKNVADSDAVRNAVIAKLDLATRYGEAAPLGVALRYNKRISTRATARESAVLTITAMDEDPAFSAKLAEAVAREAISMAKKELVTPGSMALRRLQLRQEQVERNFAAGNAWLASAGVKDWRTALNAGESAFLSLVADLQANINLQGDAQSRENSTMLLQLRLTGLQQQLSGRDSQGALLGPGVVDVVRDQFYLSALQKRLTTQIAIAQLELSDEIRLATPASVPLQKEAPRRWIYLLMGAALGLLLAVAAVAWRELAGEWTTRRQRSAPEKM